MVKKLRACLVRSTGTLVNKWRRDSGSWGFRSNDGYGVVGIIFVHVRWKVKAEDLDVQRGDFRRE